MWEGSLSLGNNRGTRGIEGTERNEAYVEESKFERERETKKEKETERDGEGRGSGNRVEVGKDKGSGA